VTLTSSDAVHTASTNLSITQGDAIGLDVPTNFDFTLNSTASAPKTPIWIPPLADGSTASPSFTNSSVGLNIQATIACAFTLSVSKTGSGSGTVNAADGSINCGATCQANYAPGTTVTLTATPSTGSTFSGWGGACSGKSTCTVTMSSDNTATATFTAAPPGTNHHA
jgi:hypothetical protein